MSNQPTLPARPLTDGPRKPRPQPPPVHATSRRQNTSKAVDRQKRKQEKREKGRAAAREKVQSSKAAVLRSVDDNTGGMCCALYPVRRSADTRTDASVMYRTRTDGNEPPRFELYKSVTGEKSKIIYVVDAASKDVEVMYKITLFSDVDAVALRRLQEHFDGGCGSGAASTGGNEQYTSQIWAPVQESTGQIGSKEVGSTAGNILFCPAYRTLVDLDTVDGIVEVRSRGRDGAHWTTPGEVGRGFTGWVSTSEISEKLNARGL